jgi:hypothetical protein
MTLDANLVISISLVGVTIIIGFVVMVSALVERLKGKMNNHQSPTIG